MSRTILFTASYLSSMRRSSDTDPGTSSRISNTWLIAADRTAVRASASPEGGRTRTQIERLGLAVYDLLFVRVKRVAYDVGRRLR
jgi:hypothetical protein